MTSLLLLKLINFLPQPSWKVQENRQHLREVVSHFCSDGQFKTTQSYTEQFVIYLFQSFKSLFVLLDEPFASTGDHDATMTRRNRAIFALYLHLKVSFSPRLPTVVAFTALNIQIYRMHMHWIQRNSLYVITKIINIS